ncbi:MAG: amidohydrolase family protein, partial [Deltaproteobacteria bacterium]|nr:amidohydrolase family protein [Deltaproteobacteria bacterium]
MQIIDADTHIDETDATWEFMDPKDMEYKPSTAYPAKIDPSRPPIRYWMIDGKRHLRFTRDDKRTRTTVESRELLDVKARLRAMDEMGTHIQVIYPTLFIVEVADRPEVSRAIRKSYNRWLANRCAESGGRMRWVCVPPVATMEEALKELRFAKDNGACGVMKKGDLEAGKWPADPYFFPLYEEAERLDLPICIHTGTGTPDRPSMKEVSLGQFMRSQLSAIHAFHTLIRHDIPGKFPNLRFGIVEANSSWIPYVAYELRRRLKRFSGGSTFGTPQYKFEEDLLKANRMYVTCQVDEDLPAIMKIAGEDNLMVGSDYTHADQSMEHEFPRLLQERADRGDIPQSAVQKILYDNAKT